MQGTWVWVGRLSCGTSSISRPEAKSHMGRVLLEREASLRGPCSAYEDRHFWKAGRSHSHSVGQTCPAGPTALGSLQGPLPSEGLLRPGGD